MYIEFNDLKKSKYTINDYEFVEFPNIVRIYFIDNVIFSNDDGFKIYSDEETCVYDFSEYFYIFLKHLADEPDLYSQVPVKFVYNNYHP